MRRNQALMAGAVLLLTALSPHARGATIQERWTSLVPVETKSCDLRELRALVADPDFKMLTGAQRSLSHLMLGICAKSDMLEPTRRATAEPEAPALTWAYRFMSELAHDNYAEAVTALETASQRSADGTLPPIDDEYIFFAVRHVRDDAQQYRRVLAALDTMKWQPSSPFESADAYRLDYAAMLLDEGDIAKARQLASDIQSARAVIKLRLDKRFDPITSQSPTQFDPVAAAKSDLAVHQSALRNMGPDADGFIAVAGDLRLLGRSEEAAQLLEAPLRTPGPIKASTGEDKRQWVMNDRAQALFESGRFDEAVALMRDAAKLSERNTPNVSQTINLSGLLNATGRHEEALATLKAFDEGRDASPYGLMWVATERACARLLSGKAALAQADLEFTRLHAKDNAMARAKVLLCAGDVNGAAAHYVERLKDPTGRSEALLELSRFKDGRRPPVHEILAQRLEAVRSRPEVISAVASAGRTMDFELSGAPLVDFY